MTLRTRGKYFSSPIFKQGLCGGEGGIRTLGRGKPTHAFQACALNRSATSPSVLSPFNEKDRGNLIIL